MIVVKVPFVEELLKYMLLLASGNPVMILRKGSKLFILTEIGNQLLVFVSKIPRSLPKEAEPVYKEFVHGKFVYLNEKGSIVISDEIPQDVRPYSGIGMFLDIDSMWVDSDGLEAIKRILTRKSRKHESR